MRTDHRGPPGLDIGGKFPDEGGTRDRHRLLEVLFDLFDDRLDVGDYPHIRFLFLVPLRLELHRPPRVLHLREHRLKLLLLLGDLRHVPEILFELRYPLIEERLETALQLWVDDDTDLLGDCREVALPKGVSISRNAYSLTVARGLAGRT